MLKFIIAILPSRLKIAVLRAKGASIGENCKIGFSLLDASEISIGDNVKIGHFNLLWRLTKLELKTGSAIVMCNWITGARVGSFMLGNNSGITRFHFFEASGNISVGSNCIIAGRGSHFFTHGISSNNLDAIRSIKIGDWSYVGSGSRFVPGAGVERGTFVGMASVVSKKFSSSYLLIAGNPAEMKKQLNSSDLYFNRPFLPQAHHPPEYEG
jgi:acetyltransferase-like isoleucine patch superfamily enzyme